MVRKETWRVALEALWANRLRAFLTTLGVVIGSACIVLVVTVAVAGRQVVLGQIEAVGSNLVYAHYQVNPQEAVVISSEITLADLNAVRAAFPEVLAVAGSSRSLPTTVISSGAEYSASLVGVTEGFQAIRNLVILQGRFLDPVDMRSRSKVCLITEELARGTLKTVKIAGWPLQRTIRIVRLKNAFVSKAVDHFLQLLRKKVREVRFLEADDALRPASRPE